MVATRGKRWRDGHCRNAGVSCVECGGWGLRRDATRGKRWRDCCVLLFSIVFVVFSLRKWAERFLVR